MGNKTGVRDRIAIFLPSLRGGGAERVMVTLANGFAERGYSVDLVLASAEGPYLGRVDDSVRVMDLKAGRVLHSLPKLIRYLRQERPKAMLSALTHANVVAIVAKICAGVSMRLVISERSTPSQEAARSTGLAQKAVYRLMRRLYPKADGIVAVSRGVAHDLARFAGLPPDSIQVIYNPFDIKHIQELSKQPLDHPWLAPGQPPVVLGVGRLTEAKDFQTLIKAFARVRAQRPARLMILGEGELRGELEALALSLGLTDDDIAMPGFVTNPYAYYARCGVFVLSSKWEGLPGVLIEAMACGAPVVATDCPSGPDEILEGGRWGALIPVGDIEALSSTLSELLDTPPKAVAKRGASYDKKVSIDKYLRALLSRI